MGTHELKLMAKDEIMFGIQTAFNTVNDNGSISEEEKEQTLNEMSFQMERIEKLFGYEPKSWTRGV